MTLKRPLCTQPQLEEVVDVRDAPLDARRRWGLIVEAVGREETIRQAVALAAPGARVALFGLPTGEVPLDLWRVVTTEIALIGGSNAPHVWPRVVELLRDGTAGVADVISDVRRAARGARPGARRTGQGRRRAVALLTAR